MKTLYKLFRITGNEMRKIKRDFSLEMARGLAGRKSSLKMIPAFVAKPTGNEKGKYLALDLGGTNLRILEVELKGKGKTNINAVKNFVLKKSLLHGTKEGLFDFIADSIKTFMRANKMGRGEKHSVGFTFSFPVETTGAAAGRLLHWTKGFNVKGVIGEDVVRLLSDALARKGLNNIKIRALANDTVGTLFAKAYEDRNCDIGVIIGTGTNTCYMEGSMAVNIEWGNFNKLRLTTYDKELDKNTNNPGRQSLEKMVSGMYLGEIARLVFKDLIRRKVLFAGTASPAFDNAYNFKAEYMSDIEDDRSDNLSKIATLLRRLGKRSSTLRDRRLIRKVCGLISTRAARISSAALAAIITKMDPRLRRPHTIAIDGSVYEKHPGFSKNIRKGLKELFGDKAALIRIALTKDGSARGAAVMAAVAGTSRRAVAF